MLQKLKIVVIRVAYNKLFCSIINKVIKKHLSCEVPLRNFNGFGFDIFINDTFRVSLYYRQLMVTFNHIVKCCILYENNAALTCLINF